MKCFMFNFFMYKNLRFKNLDKKIICNMYIQ